MDLFDSFTGGAGGGVNGGMGGAASIPANVAMDAYLPWLQAASPILGKVLSPAAGGGPSNAVQTVSVSVPFNNSGWSVATGTGTQSGTASPTATQSGGGAGGLLPGGNSTFIYLLIAAAVLGVWLLRRG